MTDPADELDRLHDARRTPYERILRQLIKAQVSGDTGSRHRALIRLADRLRWGQMVADILGRRRVLLEARSANVQRYSSIPDVPPTSLPGVPEVPAVPFEEAIADLAARMPEGISAVIGSRAEQVAAAYNFRHGFAMAKAVDVQLAKRVQDWLVKASGRSQDSIVDRVLAMSSDWTRSYVDTVVRTNLSTAYTAGRFREASDHFVRKVMPAFPFQAIRDHRVRRGRKEDHGENHLALDGMVASTSWDGWRVYAPPNGYNCRCSIRLVSVAELERRGLYSDGYVHEPVVPAGASVHPNFTTRADHEIYLGMARR